MIGLYETWAIQLLLAYILYQKTFLFIDAEFTEKIINKQTKENESDEKIKGQQLFEMIFSLGFIKMFFNVLRYYST